MGVLLSKSENFTANSTEVTKEVKNALQNEVNSIKLAEKLQIESEKINKTLSNAKEKEQQIVIATINEEATIKLAETLKDEAVKAHNIVSQIVNTSAVNEEVQNSLVDNVLVLTEKAQNAQTDAQIATKERINAQQELDTANQQAKIAADLTQLNKSLDVSSQISTDNKMNNNKFKFVNVFELKCPNNFVQQGTFCGQLVETPKSPKKNSNKLNIFNILILLIIFALIALLIYNNQEIIKNTFNKSVSFIQSKNIIPKNIIPKNVIPKKN